MAEVFAFDGKKTAKWVPGTVVAAPQRPEKKARFGDGNPAAGDTNEDAILKKLFRDIQGDVERFGSSGLDGRSKKESDARRLESLGMSAPKRARIPASVGQGMARKQSERVETARLEDAAMTGRLKKRQRPASDDGDRHRGGRDEMSPEGFRNGTLYIKKDKPEEPRGGGSAGGGMRGGGKGKRKGGAGGKGGNKKGGGKKKGGR